MAWTPNYAGVQEVCISPAQRDKKCAFRRHNAKHVFEIEKRRMPKDAADSSESVDIKVLTVHEHEIA